MKKPRLSSSFIQSIAIHLLLLLLFLFQVSKPEEISSNEISKNASKAEGVNETVDETRSNQDKSRSEAELPVKAELGIEHKNNSNAVTESSSQLNEAIAEPEEVESIAISENSVKAKNRLVEDKAVDVLFEKTVSVEKSLIKRIVHDQVIPATKEALEQELENSIEKLLTEALFALKRREDSLSEILSAKSSAMLREEIEEILYQELENHWEETVLKAVYENVHQHFYESTEVREMDKASVELILGELETTLISSFTLDHLNLEKSVRSVFEKMSVEKMDLPKLESPRKALLSEDVVLMQLESAVRSMSQKLMQVPLLSAVEQLDYSIDLEFNQEMGKLPKKVFVSALQEEKVQQNKRDQAKIVSQIEVLSGENINLAEMQNGAIALDGDLWDWGELRYPIFDKTVLLKNDKAFIRWAPEGLYFAYDCAHGGDIVIPPDTSPLEGNVIELFVEYESMKEEGLTQTHRFVFCPFGIKEEKKGLVNSSTSLLEGVLRGGGKTFWLKDSYESKGVAFGKQTETGYTAECFLSRRALSGLELLPGSKLNVKFSIKRSAERGEGFYWPATELEGGNQKQASYNPLVLAGTLAKAKFIKYLEPETVLEWIVPGKVFGIEVIDEAKNIHSKRREVLEVELLVKERNYGQSMTLKESGENTGVFRAFIETQDYFKHVSADKLNIKYGDIIELRYSRKEEAPDVKTLLPVAIPIMSQN